MRFWLLIVTLLVPLSANADEQYQLWVHTRQQLIFETSELNKLTDIKSWAYNAYVAPSFCQEALRKSALAFFSEKGFELTYENIDVAMEFTAEASNAIIRESCDPTL